MKEAMKTLLDKLKEAFMSVCPIMLIVLLIFGLQFTPMFPKITVDGNETVMISNKEIITFVVSMICLGIGMALFTLGSEKSMTKVGTYIGSYITKRKSIVMIVLVSFLLGIMITVAEPDLTVLGDLVENSTQHAINTWVFKICIGIGVGIFLVLGLLRIIFQKSLKVWLIFFYLIIFGLACVLGTNGSAICEISFDSSGVTTGPITVPFLLTFGAGVAAVRGGKNSGGDSFGVTGLCSIGPIIMSMLLFLPLQNSEFFKTLQNDINTNPEILGTIGSVALEVLIAIAPIIVFFYIFNFIFIKLPAKELIKLGIGFAYTYVGLVIFLASANIGLIPLGNSLGYGIAQGGEAYWYLAILIAVIVGFSIVLVEPSVHILIGQIEEISGRSISNKSVLISLCIGVASAIVLAVVRILYGNYFNILYYYVPLFLVALGLTFFVPDIYAAIAFDSGGVASGAMASCFVLPFVIGIGSGYIKYTQSNINISGFGVIGLIAVMPIITIEILGVIVSVKKNVLFYRARKSLADQDDDQIVTY